VGGPIAWDFNSRGLMAEGVLGASRHPPAPSVVLGPGDSMAAALGLELDRVCRVVQRRPPGSPLQGEASRRGGGAYY
jgi:hypothetical protein